MIDSITIKVHNLCKYPLIYEQFYNFGAKKRNRILEGYVDVSSGEVTFGEKERVVLYSGTSKFLPIAYSSSLFVASSDYSISVRVDCKTVDTACLEMTFSIPKYIWGCNLFQFISFPPKNSEATYSKLIGFLKEFFKKEFMQQPSFYDVEIKRIDLCYNQFFANKREAQEYQKEQADFVRNLAKSKNARFSPGNGFNWTLLTQGYSFKCYHKGEEFEKNDLPKLMKSATPYKMPRKNPYNAKKYHNEGVPKRYNLDYLASEADCILRYEITYRRSFMHYLVSYSMFQAIEPQAGYVLDNPINRYIRRADKMGVMVTARTMGLQEVSENLKEHYCRFVREYRLRSTFDGVFDFGMLFEKQASFNLGVFRLLFDTFWEKVKEVQINERSNVPENLDKVQAYRKRCETRKELKMTKKGSMVRKGGLNTARMTIPVLLSQFMDLRELKNYLPRNTYQRLMSDFKKAGVEPKATELTIVRPSLGYEDYMAALGNLISNVY